MQLKGEYLTISDMAEVLKIPYNTAKQRLFRNRLKPITTDTLYEATALKVISDVQGKGRPKKAAEPKPKKATKGKSKKTKK